MLFGFFSSSFSLTLEAQTAIRVWGCGGGMSLDFYVNVVLYICILLEEHRSELQVWLPRDLSLISSGTEFDS